MRGVVTVVSGSNWRVWTKNTCRVPREAMRQMLIRWYQFTFHHINLATDALTKPRESWCTARTAVQSKLRSNGVLIPAKARCQSSQSRNHAVFCSAGQHGGSRISIPAGGHVSAAGSQARITTIYRHRHARLGCSNKYFEH